MIVKRTIEIEKLEEKMFLVKVYIEDKLTPQQVIDMQKSRGEIIEQTQKDLDAVPKIVEERTHQLTQQLKDATQEQERFKEHENTARLWSSINEKVEARSSPNSDTTVA